MLLLEMLVRKEGVDYSLEKTKGAESFAGTGAARGKQFSGPLLMASPTTTYTNAIPASRTKAVENVLPRRSLALNISPQLRREILDVLGLVAFLLVLFMVRA